MKTLDRVLQRWRIAKARPYIRQGAHVLDVGCADGALFRQLNGLIGKGIGIDSELEQSIDQRHFRLIAGRFPDDLPSEAGPFEVITMLAVFEHLPLEHLSRTVEACARVLVPGGLVVLTVPSPAVDQILDGLKRLRLLDGMSLEEHHEFDVDTVPALFSQGGFRLVTAKRFQLGLNNLFVFEKGHHASRIEEFDAQSS